MSAVKSLFVGVAVGAALGVLFAPAKGSKTRRRLAKKGNQIRESLCDFRDTISGAIENIREEGEEIVDNVMEEGRIQVPQEQWRTT